MEHLFHPPPSALLPLVCDGRSEKRTWVVYGWTGGDYVECRAHGKTGVIMARRGWQGPQNPRIKDDYVFPK